MHLYRNSEGYSDPTVGCALAHISYEERRERRAKREAEQRKLLKQQKAEEQRLKIIAEKKRQ